MNDGKRSTLQQASEIVRDGSSITFLGGIFWCRPMAVVHDPVRLGRHPGTPLGRARVLRQLRREPPSRTVANREIIVVDYSPPRSSTRREAPGLRDGKRIARHGYPFIEIPPLLRRLQELMPAKVDQAVICARQMPKKRRAVPVRSGPEPGLRRDPPAYPRGATQLQELLGPE